MASKEQREELREVLYSLQLNSETFDLVELANRERIHPRARSITLQGIAKREEAAKQNRAIKQEVFLSAILILIEGQRHQAEIVAKLKRSSARHIKINPLTCREYLNESCRKRGAPVMTKKKQEENNAMTEETQTTNNKELKGLPELRAAWGLVDAPREYRFHLTDRHTALVRSETCRKIIEKTRTQYGEFLVEKQKDELLKMLKAEEELEANEEIKAAIQDVIKKIKASKTREHLSAISLSSAGEELTTLYVGLANPAGDALTVEGWKFVKLIEEQDTYQLIGDPPPQPAGSEPSLFAFAGRQKKNGKRVDSDYTYVYARFETTSATLQVVRTNAGGKDVAAKASFMLDPDYLIFLCETLKYLREDRERFARLREKADLKTNINVESLDKLFTLEPLKGE